MRVPGQTSTTWRCYERVMTCGDGRQSIGVCVSTQRGPRVASQHLTACGRTNPTFKAPLADLLELSVSSGVKSLAVTRVGQSRVSSLRRQDVLQLGPSALRHHHESFPFLSYFSFFFSLPLGDRSAVPRWIHNSGPQARPGSPRLADWF